MRQKDQKMRFSDAELGLFKTVFADNDDALFLFRKFMLQFELTPSEKLSLDKLMTEPVYKLMKKTFLPEIDPDAPIFQITDPWIGVTTDIKGKSPEESWPYIVAKNIEIQYLTERFDVLFSKEVENPILLSNLIPTDLETAKITEIFIGITARNWILSYIDGNLQQVKFLAGRKEETIEQTVSRLQKDSSK